MMNEIVFHVDGDPKPQPKRLAFARRTASGQIIAKVYDTGGANGWKSLVAEAARPHRLSVPIECPLVAELRFRFRRPARLMTRRAAVDEIPHDGKVDVDNLTKAVFDTLTQAGVWRDDGQVYRLTVEKFFTSKDGRPGLDVRLAWCEPAQQQPRPEAAAQLELGRVS